MAIRDKTQEHATIAEGPSALTLFTDRTDLLRLYSSYLNDDPPREQVLYLHGDGGNGKSLLLRFLRKRCSNRLRSATWQEVKAMMGIEFHDNIIDCDDSSPIPTALIDFALAPRGNDRPQEPFSALLTIRRELSGGQLRFPLFDYACIWHLHKTGRLSAESLRNIFPPEEMDLLTELAAAITQSKWAIPVNMVMKLFGKHMQEEFTLYLRHRKLPEEALAKIQQVEPRFELTDMLPELFAEDLNAALGSLGQGARVALFFDSHEALWGDRHDLSTDLFHQRDEWLRYLLTSLELKAGIVAIVAGRDMPRWHDAAKHPIPSEYVDLQHVGGLPDQDASEYLVLAGIETDELPSSLVEYARIGPNEIYPFMLALSVDVVRAAAGQGTHLTPEDFRSAPVRSQKEKALVDRLLRYVNSEVAYAVRALSACRAFNLDVYIMLANKLNFQATESSFDLLTRLSFVWQLSHRGPGWYRVHEVMRRILRERGDELVVRADEALQEYYRARSAEGSITDIAEAIYHMGRLDWEHAIEAWATAFDSSIGGARNEECLLLLELRNELRVDSAYWRMIVAQHEGDYFKSLSRYNEAIESFNSALAFAQAILEQSPGSFSGLYAKGLVSQKLGHVYALLSRHEAAQEMYRLGLEHALRALEVAPESADAYNIIGLLYMRSGELQAQLSQHQAAIESYRQAGAAFDEVLRLESEPTNANSNKATALTKLAELLTQISEYDSAKQCFYEALRLYEKLLNRVPDATPVYSNRGLAYTNLGRLFAKTSERAKAIDCHLQAISAYDEALGRSPDMIEVYNNKGSALISLGEQYSETGAYEVMIEKCTEASLACDEALKRAPDMMNAFDTKGLALLRLAYAQAKLSRYEESRINYDSSISAFDEVLRRAPRTLSALANKGFALLEAGNVLSALSEYDAAGQRFEQAASCLDEALTLAPDFVHAHTNRAIALMNLGEMKSRQEDQEIAIYAYKEALASFDRALALSPADLSLKSMRAYTLSKLGLRQLDLHQFDKAYDSFSGALYLTDQVIQKDPDSAKAHNNRGMILTNLGLVSYLVGDDDRALDFYQLALVAYEEFQRLAPDDVLPHNNKANMLIRLGELQTRLGRLDDASASYKLAVVECDSALRRSPNYPFGHSNKSLAYLRLAQLHEMSGDTNTAIGDLHEAQEAIFKALSISANEPEFKVFLRLINEHLAQLTGEPPH